MLLQTFPVTDILSIIWRVATHPITLVSLGLILVLEALGVISILGAFVALIVFAVEFAFNLAIDLGEYLYNQLVDFLVDIIKQALDDANPF